jgi:hypothetical protein
MQIKKRHSALVAAAGILLLAAALKPQIPSVGPVWEYSSVTASPTSPGRAVICYATSNGCRNEQVGSTYRQLEDALMTAATKLGEKGWELTTTAEIQSESKSERTLYFRRLQSVLNRGDSSGNH